MTLTKTLLIATAALGLLAGSSMAAEAQKATSSPMATNAKYKNELDEVSALLDSWRGESSVLEAAKMKLDRILRANPNVAAAHREYARYYLMWGYIGGLTSTPESEIAAQRSLNEAIRIDPNYAEAYILQGHLYYLQHRLEEAANVLAKAQAIGSSDPWLQLNTADVLLAQGKVDEAVARYQNVIASRTKNSKAMLGAYQGLIEVYQKTGRIAEQEAVYQQQIAYEPQSAWLYGNYGAFLLCTKDDADAAIPQFRQALERMNYGKARHGLSAALYRKWVANRDVDGAKGLYDEAHRLRTGSPFEVVASYCCISPASTAVAKALNPEYAETSQSSCPMKG